MKTDIFIVSFLKDVEWLKLCLRSICKFATGFDKVVVAVPSTDINEMCARISEAKTDFGFTRIVAISFVDSPGNGHMMHQAQKCLAPVFCDGDFIAHVDSDCIFTEKVSPEDYFVDGRPVLLVDRWENVGAARIWKAPTERAVGWPAEFETMRRHPAVHGRHVYGILADRIHEVHGIGIVDYILSQKKTDQYEFSEFNALGQIVLHSESEHYHIIDLSRENRPHDKLLQFWSHGDIDKPQSVWIDGVETTVIPKERAEGILA